MPRDPAAAKLAPMQEAQLQPWMLRADWRPDGRSFVVVDLATWPPETPFDPLPPVPVLAVGEAAHPQAHRADVLIEPPVSLDGLSRSIARAPNASATVAQLLRATEGLAPEQALTLESMAFAMLQAGSEHLAWLARRAVTSPAPPGTLHVARMGERLDVVIDRPDAANAIDTRLRDDLHDAFTVAALDPSIACVRVRSRGRAFSLGADLHEFGVTRDPSEAHTIRSRALPARPMIRRPDIYDVHVQGACVGAGLELATFAGRLTASTDAWFQLPEVAMGILPGFGGCVSIPRRIGRQRACALMLSGRRLSAAIALRWGLIDAIVDE